MRLSIDTLTVAARLTLHFDNHVPHLQLHRLSDDAICVLSARLHALGSPRMATYTVAPASATHVVAFADTAATLSITPHSTSFTVSLDAASPAVTRYVQADFDLAPASWFGLGHLMHHHWPLDKAALVLSPAYPFDNGPSGISTLIDPTFVSSSGTLLSVHDRSSHLHLAINPPPQQDEGEHSTYTWTTGLGNLHKKILPDVSTNSSRLLTVQSRSAYDHPHVSHPWSTPLDHHVHDAVHTTKPNMAKTPSLTFTLCAAPNIRDATQHSLAALRTVYGSAPCPKRKLDMMRRPIWSTWAQFKRDITQERVLSFAREIVRAGLPRSVMGIDDCWSASYGEMRFDPVKFPDPAEMVRQLHAMGFMVTLWVTPFANDCAPQFKEAETTRHYVSMPDGSIGTFKWWQPGNAAALDVTDDAACVWFIGQLEKLREQYGIDGFKFDAGEPCFLPNGSNLHVRLSCPNDYTRAWMTKIASKFAVSEVRSGVRGCQSALPMFRIFDRYSTWGLQNGLASVVTAVLTSGILGFPFCIPDYVGGNAYGDERPNDELMIRWTQASVGMPAVQMSIPPWAFDGDACTKAVSAALEWRERVFWPRIKECVTDASDKLWPIVRPMWWEEPGLEGVAQIYDQYMVGESTVVAPVMRAGQREREVFVPRGVWRRLDLGHGEAVGVPVVGPLWLEKVAAPLDDMPVYVRVDDVDDIVVEVA